MTTTTTNNTISIIAHFNTKQITVLLAALCVLFVLPFTAMASAPSVGTVTAMAGEVRVLKMGEKLPVSLKKGDGLSVGDLIQTKSNGNAKITFIDKSEMMVGPKSRLLIEEYKYDPATGTRNASLKLTKGTMGFDIPQVKDTTDNSKYVLKTKSAVAGIRGTKGIMLSQLIDKLYLKGGRILFSNPHGTIMVLPGMVVESILGQPPVGSIFTPEEYNLLLQNLTLSGAGKGSSKFGPGAIVVVIPTTPSASSPASSSDSTTFQNYLSLIQQSNVPVVILPSEPVITAPDIKPPPPPPM